MYDSSKMRIHTRWLYKPLFSMQKTPVSQPESFVLDIFFLRFH